MIYKLLLIDIGGTNMRHAIASSDSNEKEGIIDKKFANLVNKKTCAEISARLNLKEFLLLGESYRGGKKSDEKITSDALEALIGAIFLDKDLKESENFIINNWKEYINKSSFAEVRNLGLNTI